VARYKTVWFGTNSDLFHVLYMTWDDIIFILMYICQAIAIFGYDDNYEQSNNVNVMHN
jgi:hypothetical protein